MASSTGNRIVSIQTLIDKVDPDWRKDAYTWVTYEFDTQGRDGKPREFKETLRPGQTYGWAQD
jgi:hypothetical protein